MRQWTGILLSASLVASACGGAGVAESSTGTGDTTTGIAPIVPPGTEFVLSDTDADRVDEMCKGVFTSLIDRDTQQFISTTDRIRGLMSGAQGSEPQLELLLTIGTALSGASLDEKTLGVIAPDLVSLSSGLFDAGAEECAVIGEMAGSFVGRQPTDPVAVQAELSKHRDMWEAEGPVTYAMHLSFDAAPAVDTEYVCGMGDLVIQVEDGGAEKAVDRFGGCTVPTDGSSPVPITVEDLFELVAANSGADILDVHYDPVLGYPQSIFAQTDEGFIEASILSFTPGILATGADAVLEELALQRATWEASGIGSYEFTVAIHCFCPEETRGPFDITVTNGAIVSVFRSGEDVTRTVNGSYFTVDELFVTIEHNAYADRIDVSYDTSGYPTLIDIDPSLNTIDEELTLTVPRLLPAG